MARVWAGKGDVDLAVDTIARCIEETGVIPETLIRAYWTSIDRSTHGLVQRFYEQLTAKCPQALEYFVQRPVELDKKEEEQK